MKFQMQRNRQIGIVFFVFGIMTIISGGRSLFTDIGLSTRGNIVPLVLWFNFIAGFFYVIAGASLFKLKPCVKRLSFVLAILNAIVLVYLVNHIYQGGLYEKKTVLAMSFRTIFWVTSAVYFHRSIMFNKIECHY